MSLITTDHDTLSDLIASHDTLLVLGWASWCPHCQRFEPIFKAVAEATTDVTFGSFQVDASAENEAAFDELGLSGVPSLMLFKNGHWVDTVTGELTRAELVEVVDRLRSWQPASAIAL